jgi:hypothetical protein
MQHPHGKIRRPVSLAGYHPPGARLILATAVIGRFREATT